MKPYSDSCSEYKNNFSMILATSTDRLTIHSLCSEQLATHTEEVIDGSSSPYWLDYIYIPTACG